MEVRTSLYAKDRSVWRGWLEANHMVKEEIWLLFTDQEPHVSYLDAVEEALCFGWIDSIQKRLSTTERAQRFSPRRKGSNWTELNKARVRRLRDLGLMTQAGLAVAPNLELHIDLLPQVREALMADPQVWETFQGFPELYKAIRIGYIQEQVKNHLEFQKRLDNFVQKTRQNQMFGNWTDGGRLG